MHSPRDSCEILRVRTPDRSSSLLHTKHCTTRPSETSRSSYIKAPLPGDKLQAFRHLLLSPTWPEDDRGQCSTELLVDFAHKDRMVQQVSHASWKADKSWNRLMQPAETTPKDTELPVGTWQPGPGFKIAHYVAKPRQSLPSTYGFQFLVMRPIDRENPIRKAEYLR